MHHKAKEGRQAETTHRLLVGAAGPLTMEEAGDAATAEAGAADKNPGVLHHDLCGPPALQGQMVTDALAGRFLEALLPEALLQYHQSAVRQLLAACHNLLVCHQNLCAAAVQKLCRTKMQLAEQPVGQRPDHHSCYLYRGFMPCWLRQP